MAGVNIPVTFTGDTSALSTSLVNGVKSVSPALAQSLTGSFSGLGKRFADQGRQLGTALSTALRTVTTGAAAATGAAMAGVLSTALNKGFSRLVNIDNAETKLRALGNTTEDVAAIMEAAGSAVDGTAFSLDAAATAAAQLGAAGVGLDDMELALRQIGALATTTGSDFADISSIYTIMAANGKVTGDVLQRLGERGSDAAARLSEHFGVTREELTKMVSSGKVSFADFQEAMSGLDDAALIAGGSFSSMVANIQTNIGKLGANLLGPVFDQLKGSDGVLAGILDQIKALRPVTEQFGQALGDAFYVLVGGLTGQSEINEFDGALRTLNNIAVTINETFGAVAEKISSVWASMSGGQQTATIIAGLVGGIAAFGTALGPLLGALGPLGGLIGSLIPNLGQLGGLFKFMLGPLGIVIGLFAAAFATSEEFRGAVFGLVQSLLPLAQTLISALGPVLAMLPGLFNMLVKAITPLMTVLVQVGTQLISALVPVIQSLIASILPPLMKLFMALVPAISKLAPVIATLVSQLAESLIPVIESLLPVVETVFGALGAIIEGIIPIITGIVDAITAIFQGDWSAAWDAFAGIGQAAMDLLWTFVGQSLEVGEAIIQGLLDGIESMFGSVGASIADLGRSIIDWFKGVLGISSPSTIFIGFGKDILQGLINGIKSLLGAVGAAISGVAQRMISLFTGAKDKVVGVFSSLVSLVRDAISRLASAVSSGIGNVVDYMSGFPGRVVRGLGRLGSLLYSAGRDLIQGLMNGITAMAGAVAEKAKSVVSGAINGAKKLLGIASPSKVFMAIGEDTGEGLVIGLDSMLKAVSSAGEGLAEAVRAPALDLTSPSSSRRINLSAPVATEEPTTVVNLNEYGPRTYSAKRRETEWAGKYSTRARNFSDGALAIP